MNDNLGPTLRRQEEIRKLIAERPVLSQRELGRLLEKRGFGAAQPTLSRDVRELGLVKGADGYHGPEAASVTPPPQAGSISERRATKAERLVRDHVLSAEVAGTLVVLRTAPAGAQPVALAIDAAGIEGVVGTIAGDDTIFLAVRTGAEAGKVARRLSQLLRDRDSGNPARFSMRRRAARPAPGRG
jgi:transcriptional regulator of arginine metabolism